MSRGGTLDALTGLRFWAALYVVVFHFGGGWFEGTPGWMVSIYQSGYVSVGLFFVLSGFVLAYSYLGPEGRMKAAPRAFWAARLGRVYPVYVLALVLLAPHVIAGSMAANTVWVSAAKLAVGGGSALLLVHAWLPPAALYWNPPGWSVAVEAFFYALFPAATAVLAKLRLQRFLLALVALWGLGLLPSLVYLGLDPDGQPASIVARGTWLTVLEFNPVLRLPEFLMGVVLGRFFLREAPTHKGSGAWMAAGAALLTLGATAASAHLPFALMHNALLAPVHALLVYGLARGGGALGWFLSRPFMVRLGAASYALYILEHPVWVAVNSLAESLAPWVELRAPRPLFAVYLPLVVGASLLCHRWVEAPMREWVRRVLQPWVERRESAPEGVSVGTPRA
ncbi:acyltransferase family protein [Hyalangium versicolor]|uniref:acyltransferase family protein n=1 Tax=Hyalangium versicolor TaxID=2861190 RepID=UPI001CC91387|nr:acyltransferase [Hyalangium versicolor]